MKKTYQLPDIYVEIGALDTEILQLSTKREVGGDPTTTDGKTIPVPVYMSSSYDGMSDGKGTGNNGTGNRTNSGLWDD